MEDDEEEKEPPVNEAEPEKADENEPVSEPKDDKENGVPEEKKEDVI